MANRTVSQICDQKTAPTIEELLGLLDSIVAPNSRSELQEFELKLHFDGTTRGWAELLKDIASMANYGGGIICFGVGNDGSRIGLPYSLQSKLDPAEVSNKLSRKTEARVATNFMEGYQGALMFAFLIVRAPGHLVVFDSDGDFNDEEGHPKKAFHKGVVYTRIPGGNSPASQQDLDLLVNRLIEQRTRLFLSRIERVAHLPPDSEIIATDPATDGRGYVLSGSGRGVPVSLKHAESGEASLPITEILTTSVPFGSLGAEITHHVRLWRQADARHRVSRETLTKWYLRRKSINFDDDTAELSFVSALEGSGYPMSWAAVMSRERLIAACRSEIHSPKYRVRELIPLVIGIFFWNERNSLLRPNLGALRGRAARIAEKVLAYTDTDRSSFVLYSKSSIKSFNFEGETHRYSEFISDHLAAQAMFEKLLDAESRGKSTYQYRYYAQRFDMMIAAQSLQPGGLSEA
ncbi:MAG: ATP-binding protein [Thermoplasmata archaeon]|nr:ATP-binding protein [Thermoplasmata archaeon]MCI4359781.1 ATP-binding protein [Thermoplasmata archaeon]